MTGITEAGLYKTNKNKRTKRREDWFLFSVLFQIHASAHECELLFVPVDRIDRSAAQAFIAVVEYDCLSRCDRSDRFVKMTFTFPSSNGTTVTLLSSWRYRNFAVQANSAGFSTFEVQ